MKRLPYVALVSIAFFLVAADKKSEKAKEPAPSAAQIQKWVKQLGDDDIKVTKTAEIKPDVVMVPISKNFIPNLVGINVTVNSTFLTSFNIDPIFRQKAILYGMKLFKATISFEDKKGEESGSSKHEITKIELKTESKELGEEIITFEFTKDGSAKSVPGSLFKAVRINGDTVKVMGSATELKTLPFLKSITAFGSFNTPGKKKITIDLKEFEIFIDKNKTSKTLITPKDITPKEKAESTGTMIDVTFELVDVEPKPDPDLNVRDASGIDLNTLKVTISSPAVATPIVIPLERFAITNVNDKNGKIIGKRFKWFPSFEELSSGEHTVSIFVKDKAGNPLETEFTFTLP